MFRPFSILTILFLQSCNAIEKNNIQKQTEKTDTEQNKTVSYDTLPNGIRLLDNLDSGMHFYYKEVVGSDTLKGGYVTCYGIDESTKYFYLQYGDTLHLLNKTPKYTSTWSLGTLEKDFPTFFITRIDNGNGVPETYQVFDKKTAKNLLGDNTEAWNFKFWGDTLFFLYDNHTVNLNGNYIDRKEADSIFLFNVKSGNRQGFKLPKENPDDIIYYDIEDLSKHRLTISRRDHYTDEEKLVKYSR